MLDATVQQLAVDDEMHGGMMIHGVDLIGPHGIPLPPPPPPPPQGIRTVDVGAAQLSMHSVRETMGAADVKHCVAHFTSVFENFPAVDSELPGDAQAWLGGVSALPACGVVGAMPAPRPVARSFF
jgi:hypothetical protein